MANLKEDIGGDVKAASVTATGAVVPRGARLRGLHFNDTSGGTAGSVVLRDGGAGGTVKLTINTPGQGASNDVMIPGAGIVFDTDIHVTLTNVDGVTVFYQ